MCATATPRSGKATGVVWKPRAPEVGAFSPGRGAICKKTVAEIESPTRYTPRPMTDPREALEASFVPPTQPTAAFARLIAQLDAGLGDEWTEHALMQAWNAAPNAVGPLLVLLAAGDRVALLRGLSACARGALDHAPAGDPAPIAALDAIEAFLAGALPLDEVARHSAAIAELTWSAAAPLVYAACAVDHVCRAVAEPAPSTDAVECVVVAAHEYVRVAVPAPDPDVRLVQLRAVRGAMLEAMRAAVPCPSLAALRCKSDLGLAREYEHILAQL